MISATLSLPYGNHPRQRIDVFVPDAAASALVCCIGGGWWADGRCEAGRGFALLLAAHGLAVATLGHRPLGDGARTGDEVLSDLGDAAGKALEEAGVLGFSGRSLALLGHGSGSLAALNLVPRLARPPGRPRGGRLRRPRDPGAGARYRRRPSAFLRPLRHGPSSRPLAAACRCQPVSRHAAAATATPTATCRSARRKPCTPPWPVRARTAGWRYCQAPGMASPKTRSAGSLARWPRVPRRSSPSTPASRRPTTSISRASPDLAGYVAVRAASVAICGTDSR